MSLMVKEYICSLVLVVDLYIVSKILHYGSLCENVLQLSHSHCDFNLCNVHC